MIAKADRKVRLYDADDIYTPGIRGLLCDDVLAWFYLPLPS